MNAKFTIVKRHIIKSIDSKEYTAGDYVLSENTLSEKCRLSRSTVRKALLSLEKEGVLASCPGKGWIVVDRGTREKFPHDKHIGINISFAADVNYFYTPAIQAILDECNKKDIKLDLIHEAGIEKIAKRKLIGLI